MNELRDDAARPVRDGEQLDAAKLAQFLGGPVTIEQFPGGHSNLTYLVHQGDRELVLRRPPFGSKVKSAHDMGREVAVLSKLAPVYDRAPHVIAYEPTGDVLGAPFYLMERRRGVILRKDVPDDPALIARVCDLLVDALVDLHAVDYAAAGLGDFGKPAGYVGRQVSGWVERYAGSMTDDIAAMATAGTWLTAHQPADGPPALIHNDFKFDNVIFDSKLERITGVLDWEMATIGDPLMDLGTALAYWMQSNDGPVFQNVLFGVTTKPHMPARAQIAQRYFERSGRRTEHLVFYYVFGLYKTAVILQQIYYRYAKGLTTDARFAPFIMVVRAIADLAQRSIDNDAI
ncbi:MAG TPA: phosphotransferase family protein [Kofleriaceae bacterium]|nr:phosphotransferase family protein [Kofleriaceae bacterium]